MKIIIDRLSEYNIILLNNMSDDLIWEELIIESDKDTFLYMETKCYVEKIKETKNKIRYKFTNKKPDLEITSKKWNLMIKKN